MGKPVLLWEPCYSLGKKPHSVGCTKSKDWILLADLVCFEVQCLPWSAHLKIFLILAFWWRRFKSILNTIVCFLHQLLLVCLLLCFLLLLLLSVYFLAPNEDNFLSKALVFYCFLVLRRVDMNTFPKFCSISFVNLTSSCSLIPPKKNVFFHIHEITRVVVLY